VSVSPLAGSNCRGRLLAGRLARAHLAAGAVVAVLALVMVASLGAPSAARADYQPTSAEYTQIGQFLAKGGAAPGTAGMDCGSGCQSLMAAQAALPPNSRGGLIRRGLAALRTNVGELPKSRLLSPVGLSIATGWRVGNLANSKFLHLGWNYEEDAEWTQPRAYFCQDPDGCPRTWGVFVETGEWFILWWFQSSASHGWTDTYVEEGPDDGCTVDIRPPVPPWPFAPRVGTEPLSCRKNPCCWPPVYGTNVGVGYATKTEEDILGDADIVPYTDQPYDRWTQNWDGAPADGDEVIAETPGVLDSASGVDQELAKDFILSQFTSTVDNPQVVADRTTTILDNQSDENKRGTTEDIIEDCSVPLWHYTNANAAQLIYTQQRLFASQPNPPHPSGAFATTITPLDDWTQSSLGAHLGIASAQAWVLMCWDVGPNRAFRPEGTPDYWYIPADSGDEVRVAVAAWGFNPMPAN
jgi:hypothetical protein